MADTTAKNTVKVKKPRGPGRPFKSGEEWNGNASGRPKGSRHKFSEEYIADVHMVWREGGIDALRTMCKEDPAAFVTAAGRLVAREFALEEETSHSFGQVWQMIADQGKKADAEGEGE
jgi:hypothetical protein